ncbi:MAG: sugar ABC transporter substrate-binding protein [Lachnospiraceae bacterium]|nr:sugar ABC transporter substrate-binding protein [Lachnospiraceae bacterium]
MKRRVLSLLLASVMTVSAVACTSNGGGSSKPADTNAGSGDEGGADANAGAGSEEAEPTTDTSVGDTTGGGQLVDGKFPETRSITVEVYDRGNDGGSDPTNNMYTKYIHDGMLNDYNVDVQFVAVPRWTEVDELNNLLAAGTAPDICLTYDYATIQTYANMGGVTDLAPLVQDNAALLPNLFNWLTDTNVYWDKDPDTGSLWAIEGKRATTNRINTFIRKDWLEKLNLEEPTTTEEFYNTIVAFRDNADTLLGKDADKMIPYAISYDVGWRAATLIESFIDPDISTYDFYINGFDDRKLTEPGTKDALKLLNQWYHEDLLWKDFALYSNGDTTEDDYMKAGYVGAFTHNWDYPFRNGDDSINANLKRTVGEDAKFVAIDPFTDKNGGHTKYVTSTAGDRKIFFPTTNDEQLASLLYLEWISMPEHIQYLQLGDEGVTCKKLDDGAYESIAATGDPIMNSGFNIDYTITCNGLNLVDPEATAKSIGHSYSGIEPEIVERANEIAQTDAIQETHVNVGVIEAEEGMGTALADKRDILYDNVILADPADFDAQWDSYMSDYLSSGGQAIIDERAEKWAAKYGDAKSIPEK